MTCGNPIKHKFQNALNSFIDAISYERKSIDNFILGISTLDFKNK